MESTCAKIFTQKHIKINNNMVEFLVNSDSYFIFVTNFYNL